jgi:serine phosphatase RsbU (regulator of sigma subunit)
MGLYYNLTQRSNDPRGLSHNAVRFIYEDREGVLRIGTWGEVAQANLPDSAREVPQALIAEVQAFVGDEPRFDDIALMVVLRGSAPE